MDNNMFGTHPAVIDLLTKLETGYGFDHGTDLDLHLVEET